ncbi:MAG TPA: VIT domain-containing protein, partial [Byssovorax sp.]
MKKLAAVLFAFACGCQPGGESTLVLASAPSYPTPALPLGYLAPPRARDAAVAFDAAFAKRYETAAAPPVRLAASDGSELGLKSLSATVTVEGPLAHTELHFTFTNPDARQKEGRFSITLPAGAAVGRFAMKNADGWREARVVSREQGRKVYEAYLKRKIDPALLEQDDGNTFSARVFPITASADKELIVAYDEPVDGDYTLGLAGLPPVDDLQVDLVIDGKHETFRTHGESPTDLVVPVGTGTRALVSGKEFVARVQLPSTGAPESLASVLFLVDTSASRAPLFAQQAALVHKLAGSLPSDARIAIAVFDQGVTEVFRGAAHEAEVNGILAHGALGASDLGAALAYASQAGFARVVVIGDGAPTIGEREPAKLAAAVGHGIERIDAVKLGATVDRDVLGAVVGAGARPGAILDARDPARLVRQLATALMPEREIHVEGAREVWPATTRGVAPGDPVWIAGRGTLGTVRIGTQTLPVTADKASEMRVPRAVARAELAALADKRALPTADTAAIDNRIREVALANQLVSSQTSLIVLESDEDERRMLGPQPPPPAESQPGPTAKVDPEDVQVITGGYDGKSGGEVISIQGTMPTIDVSETTQGITIDKNYLKNIPVAGRSFEAAIGASAGAQGDHMGVSFSGASSLQNHYYVDGINTHGRGGYTPPPPLARA